MSADSSETPTPEESGDRTPDDAAPGSAPTPQAHSDTAGHWIPPSLEHLQGLLPNYEFLEILGHGGMGAVYKARQLSLDRLVAIKILPPGIAAVGDNSFVERFKNEARTMAKMNHPGIVNVYDFGQTAEGQLYLVMEYIDGTDVAKMVHSQGRLPQEYALAIAAHVCDALQYAHTHGVIHRDIKPANVLINMEGQVKVADFGLAKAKTRGAQSTALTDTNITMGTPDYVAPEALVIGMEPDHRADLYAMGVMLYNMLTGEIPRGRFKPVSEKTGGDPRFDIIINKAMQERDARYQTALNMRRDLDVILTVPLAKSDATSSTIPKQFAQQNAIRKPVARRPSAPYTPPPAPPPQKSGALVGIIVLALLAGGGFFAWKQLSKQKPIPADSSGTTVEATPPANLNPKPSPGPVPDPTPPPKAPEAIADEAGFTPLFGAAGIRDWQQSAKGKWDFSSAVLSCQKSDKGTARLRCPKDFAPADFEIRFSVRGDRGPALEFRGSAADRGDCYVCNPASLRSGGSIFWDEKRHGVFAKAGQRLKIAHDDHLEELPEVTALPKWKDGDWNEVVLTVQGHHFTCACNGLIAAEYTDESPSYRAGPGEFGFRVTSSTDGELSVEFKEVRIRRLPNGPAASASTVAVGTAGGSYPQPPTWTDCTQVLQAQSDKIVADGEWLTTTGKAPMPTLAPHKTFQNPIVRVQYSGRVDIALRRQYLAGEDVRYEAGIGATGASLELTRRVNGGRLAPAVKLGPSYRPTDEHVAVFAAQGTTVSLCIDGQNVIAVQDSTLSSGQIALLLKNDSNGTCRIKKVEYGELPDVSVTAGNPTSPNASSPHEATVDTSWTDVLPLVQLPRDLSEKLGDGEQSEPGTDWKLETGVMSATKSGIAAVIAPDLSLPESYDLSLRVKASSSKGSSVGAIVPVGSHHMAIHLQLYNFECSGFETIDGKNVTQGGLTTIRPAVLHENVEQTVYISVRSHGGDASVALKVDGKPAVDWSGKEASLSLFWRWDYRVKRQHLGLCASLAAVSFRDVRVRRMEDNVIVPPVIYGEMRTFKGHSYQLVFDRALSWTDAKMKAEKMGGHLATITSKEEDAWIIATFTNALKDGPMGTSFWLGASQATTKADWQWVTGEPFKFTSWGHGEPNATPGEGSPIGLAYAYGAKVYQGSVGWNDIPFHANGAWGPETSLGYLVEWDTAQVVPVAKTPAPAPAEKWTDWLVEQRRNGKLPKGLAEDGIGYKVTSPKILIPVGPAMKDGAIRVTGSRRTAGTVLLLLRCLNPDPKLTAAIPYSRTYRLQWKADGLQMFFRETGTSNMDKIGDPLTGPDDGSKTHVIEFRMVGNVLSVFNGGNLLLNTRDTHITEGQPCLLSETGGWFEKIEVLNLDGPHLPPLLLSQYTFALTRERDASPPEEKGAYNVELARLKTDPTLPQVDAPGTSDAVAKLRKKARALLGGVR